MKLKKDQRTILLISLSVIALIMVVGFAAFSTSLNINGTANISTNWCVGFDNTKTNTYEITKGKSTGTSPDATMGYDGTACSSTYVPIANLGAVFYQPGDKIEYTLTIANKGSIDAVIESITVDGSSVTSNQTITKGNIIWKVYMPASTTLQATTGTTTMVVSAEFQNKTDLVSYNAHETQTITVGINAVQNNGSNALTVTPSTQTVYSWNTDTITVGTSQLTDLVSTKTTNPYYISEADIQSALNGKTGSTIYNKYTVENDTITEGYACQTFGILSRAECIKMSTDGSEYGYDAGGNHTGNAGILKALQSNSTFTGASGSCSFRSSSSNCYVGDLGLSARSIGYVGAGDTGSGAGCYVYNDGGANCGE